MRMSQQTRYDRITAGNGWLRVPGRRAMYDRFRKDDGRETYSLTVRIWSGDSGKTFGGNYWRRMGDGPVPLPVTAGPLRNVKAAVDSMLAEAALASLGRRT